MEGIFVKKRRPGIIISCFALALVAIAGPIFLELAFAGMTRGVLIGVLITVAAVWLIGLGMLLSTNRNAFLRLDSEGIQARYGQGFRLECTLDQIRYIAVGPDSLTLEVDGKFHDISGLANVGQIAQWLKQQLPFVVPGESREALLAQHTNARRNRKRWLIGLALAALGWIGLIALLGYVTRDKGPLDSSNLGFFLLFLLGDCLALSAGFLCAIRAGSCIRHMAVSHDKLRILAIATTPLPQGDSIGVFYNGGATRLTLFADPQDRIYYITEALGPDYLLHIAEECEPTHDTSAIDRKIDAMKDIGFLFGME